MNRHRANGWHHPARPCAYVECDRPATHRVVERRAVGRILFDLIMDGDAIVRRDTEECGWHARSARGFWPEVAVYRFRRLDRR